MPKHPLCPVAEIFHALSFNLLVIPQWMAPVFLVPVKDTLKPLSSNCTLYLGHSFRRGGATWPYQVVVPVDTLRIIGDWKSNAYRLLHNSVKSG